MRKPKPPSRDQILTTMYRTDFIAFVSLAFPIVYPGKRLLKNWHIDMIADALHGCLRGKHNCLAIYAPPRSLKSFIASIAFPAFALGNDPTRKVLSIVASQAAASDICEKLARLLDSSHYRTLFPHVRRVTGKRQAIRLSHGGSFSSAAFFSSAIPRDADVLIVDDPISHADARNVSFNEQAAEWFMGEIVPRFEGNESAIAILAMPRLAKNDLSCAFFRGRERQTLEFTAISRCEERWPLPTGEVYIRPPRTPLNESREKIEDIWSIYNSMDYGDFACRILQDVNAKFFIGGDRYYPFDTTDWTPDKGKADSRRLFSNKWYITYECFGVGRPPPYLAKNPLTPEQQQATLMLSQAKLLRESMEEIERMEREERTRVYGR